MIQLMNKGNVSWLEVRLKRKDGTAVWGTITAKSVYEEHSQNLAYFDCTIEDINERKKALAKAREEEETRRRFEKLLSPDLAEMVASGKLKVEQGGETRFCNGVICRYSGIYHVKRKYARFGSPISA
ncbi:MAG: PAS domain S-box protein [Desulfobacteraceae bacterium]|nr:PAS domain S-box protein [Desulfobacteraceae bacterium]